ncbi:MAG TPA: hypothetical protein ENK05_03880 [Gammaproteobacteria bacterium]|nr:hypothetical protein [Gammaproteobacteria bacterium]
MFQRFFRQPAGLFLLLVSLLQLSGCGGGSSDSADTVAASGTTVVTGSVGDGPIAGATLNIYDRDGNLIQTETSDSNASYSARIVADASAYPLTIEVVGGIDLVTGRAPDFKLVSVMDHPSVKHVNINPFSTLIVEAARTMAGGLSEENIARVRETVMAQLNFGLDPDLIADPIGTPVSEKNAAAMVKASEALGEMIRRVRDRMAAGGGTVDADQVVRAIAGDVVDGVLDGAGDAAADRRISALSILVSAEVLIESLSNNLRVDGMPARAALDNAVAITHPETSSDGYTGNVRTNAEVLQQVRQAVDAARSLTPDIALSTLATTLDRIAVGSLPSEIETVLPADSSQDLAPVLQTIMLATDSELDAVIGPPAASQDSPTDATGSGSDAGSSTGGSDPAPVVAPLPANRAPVIGGTPQLSVDVGASYVFQPTASDRDGDTLVFSIRNRPSWANFNSRSGRLSGTPAAGDEGSYGNIVISVTDGSDTVALPAFRITVNSVLPATGSVTLKWNAPVMRSDGTPLTMAEIAGYTVYYGTEPGNYTESVDINDAYTTSITISDLPLGTYYFVLTTRDTDGRESSYSSMATKQAQ